MLSSHIKSNQSSKNIIVPRCKFLLIANSLFHYRTLKQQRLQVPILVGIVIFLSLYFLKLSHTNRTNQPINDDHFSNKNTKASSSSKILCYVLLSETMFKAALVIQNTWGSQCDKLIFFGRFSSPEVSVTFLNATEGYANLWGKTKAALISLQEYADSYDWFIKADSDTYVIIKNLRKFLVNLNPEHPTWFGYKLKHSKIKQGYMSGGAGYTFSKKALKKIGALLINSSNGSTAGILQQQCGVKGTRGYEDLELGKCFSYAGVREISTLDIEGKERFLPLPLNTLLSGDLSTFHWIWQKAWNPPRVGQNCCSKELISMHQISPSGMQTIHFLLEAIKTS